MTIMSCTNMKKTQFNIAFPIKIVDLDPHKMEDIYSMTINTQLNSSLLRYLSDGEIESSIAKSWSVSEDGLTYIIKLDQKKFSNGDPIEAKDVIKSLKRIFIKEASIAVDLGSIKGVSKYIISKNPNDIEITEVAPDEIKILLDKPNAALLKQLATPDAAILKLNDHYEINSEQISSGKYKLIQKTAEGLTLEFWNPDNHTSNRPPSIIKILLLEKDIRADLALNDKIDLVNLDSSIEKDIKDLKKNKWKETLGSLSQENILIFNPRDVALIWRKYFFEKFATDKLLDKLAFNNKAPAYGYVPTTLQGSVNTPFQSPPPLVNESDLTPFTLVISYMQFSGINEISVYLKENWNHPKLKIETKELKVNEFMEKLLTRKMQSYVITKGLDYPDAMANLAYFKSDLKENFFLIDDKDIDQKILECSASSSKKDGCFKEIQKKIYEKQIVLPLYYGSNKSVFYSKNVKVFPSHPLGLQFMTLDQVEMK